MTSLCITDERPFWSRFDHIDKGCSINDYCIDTSRHTALACNVIYSTSSDVFVGRHSFSRLDREGGQAWFSCLKNSSRSPSLDWHEIYNFANNAQFVLRVETCCDALDILRIGVLNKWRKIEKNNLFYWIVQGFRSLNQTFLKEIIALLLANGFNFL